MSKRIKITATSTIWLLILGSLLFSHATLALTMDVTISARSNIFDSGHPTPNGPTVISFSAGPGQFFTFSDVLGTITCCAGDPDPATWSTSNGPDGSGAVTNASGTTDILSLNGISGIKYGIGDTTTNPPTFPYEAGKTMFLTGVFLDDNEPHDPAPSRLDFTTSIGIGEGFTELAPDIAQTFFVGDGLTGTGSGDLQRFLVPDTATRLFLGFADAVQFGFPTSSPCCYTDNYGQLAASATLHQRAAAPIPGTLLLLASGLGLIRWCTRRGQEPVLAARRL